MYRRKKVVLLFFILFSLFTHTPRVYGVDAWWDASWQKRIKITFANAGRAENLTNFPVLVSLSSSRIDFSDVNSNGSDLRFVDADGTTVLDYEIEKWNPSGTSSVWVRVPQIDASSDTDYIYLYYKNAGASSGANPSGVWDSSYLSVLHMGDNPTSSGPQQDSTANNSDATSIALSATTTGAIGDALDLNGTTQYVQYASTTLPTPLNAGTVEVIYNPDTFASDVNGRYLFTKDKSGTYMGEWRLMLGSESAAPAQSNKLAFRIECPTSLGGNGNAWAVVSDIAPQLAGGWYSATAVWNKAGGAGNMKLYWNGTATGTPYLNTTAVATADPTCAMEVSGEKPEIGRNNGKTTQDGYFDGQMDEFRISNVVRSANWINATYASSFDTLNTYASAETPPDTTPPVISSVASTTAVTTATVTWTTDESSDSAVWYGTLSGSYTTSTTSASLVTSHSLGLTGLSAESTYYFVVVSKDASNNTSTSSEYTLLTTAAPDTTAPVISSVATSTTSTTATITWSTNENATSTVNYGTTSSYGSASTSASFTTSHSITLTGLSPLTTYHFQVSSGDSSYNYATTSDYTVVTGASTPSAPTSLVATGYDGKVNVKWTNPGGTITDYAVEYKLSSDSVWSMFSDGVSTATSSIVTGLTNNSAYDFRVTTINSGSYSASSSPVSATPQVVISFISPTITGGTSTTSTSITGYASSTIATPSYMTFRLETNGGTLVSEATTTTRYGDYNISNLATTTNKQDLSITGDLSGVAYVPTTDTLFTIHNNQNVIHEVTRAGVNVRTITCSSCNDAEDITLVSSVASTTVGGYDHTFLISTEDVDTTNHQVFRVVIHSTGAATVNRTTYYSTGISSSPYTNNGLEGVAYNSNTGHFYAALEGQQNDTGEPKLYEVTPGNIATHSATNQRICTNLNFRDYTTTDATRFPASPGYADISGLYYEATNNHLYVLSHMGDKMLELDISDTSNCVVLRQKGVVTRADSGSNFLFEMPEGISWDSTGEYLYVGTESDYWSVWRTTSYGMRNTFSGLSDGSYNLYASVTDTDGITSTTTARSFTVGSDVTAPSISSVASSTDATSATITWSTNEAASSSVRFGLSTAYSSGVSTSSGSTSHSVNLSGLNSGTLYHFAVYAADASGNSATTTDYTFTTTSALDTTPPVISSVASTTTVTTATVTWTTDESSDSTVWYGTLSGSYTTSTTSASLVTSHSLGLTGLSAESTYYFVVVSKDASNNTSTSSEYTLLTTAAPDTTAPVISSVATSTTSTTATITWSTNENATSTVNYGTTSSYGSASTSASFTTSHSITLTGLSPLTTYHFQVSSGDSSYNYATTSDYTVVTGADTTGPTISNISVSETSSGGTISWTTDELASSLVAYGPGTTFGATTTETDTSPRVLSHSVVFSDLLACSRYFFRIASEDAAGNRSYSSESAFSTTGCTGSASIEEVEVENLDVSTGGALSVGGSGQQITLDIPADATATSSSLTFQLKIISDSSVIDSISTPADKSVAEGHIYDLKAFINATTTLSTFDEPLTITLSYDDSDVRGVSESSLLIYRYDSGSWTPLSNCSVNTSANTITCETDHFSVFGLFGTTQRSSSGGGKKGGSSNKPKNTDNTVATSTPALNNPVVNISVFTKLLVLGTVDTEVLTLQRFLNRDPLTRVATTGVGSPGFETSRFGELTKEAVIKFQIKNGIIASRESVSAGVVGPQTRLKLNSLITDTSTSPVVTTPSGPVALVPSNQVLTENLVLGTISPQVKILQQFLNQDLSTQIAQSGPGSNGQETEKFGSLTKEAVIKFQIKYGIIKDRTDQFAGTVGPNTREKINLLLKK